MDAVALPAAVELHQRPVVGWLAAQIGTIFVERKDQASRKEARRIIAKVLARSAYPPVIVFPEGRLGLGDQVLSLPLRHLRDGAS
ncbi:MAG: 1-acyl-sn-glycerol-3-phosphate acyltransferase [Caldilineaceae bacterium]